MLSTTDHIYKQLGLLRTMLLAIDDMDDVLELPLTIPTCDRFSTSIKATNNYTFEPLPEAVFATLQKRIPQRALTAPIQNLLTDWAHLVTNTCSRFTKAKRNFRINDKEIKCASLDTAHPIYESQALLRQGEGWWYATAFLFLASPRRDGCIIRSYEERPVTCSQILRCELLTLLSLLEIAGIRALQHNSTARNQPVFLLCFTQYQARVLEAHFKEYDKISVSIRQVLNKVPTEKERDQAFEKVIRWSMLVDSNNAYSLGERDELASTTSTLVGEANSSFSEKNKSSGLPVRLVPSTSTAAASTAAATTRMNSHSDKSGGDGGGGPGGNWRLICWVSIFFIHVSFVKRLHS
ncbi:hypothetical protein F4860DRAFT_155581 [Xylaria cubensis]|nr:hypothetical protein F4860DRAFT_155581 [Xylaria cubensis]